MNPRLKTITIPAEELRRAVEDVVARRLGTHLANLRLSGEVVAEVEERDDSPDKGGVPVGGRVVGRG